MRAEFQVMGALAEYDRAMLVAKLRGARARKKARTGRCDGVLPFGRDVAEQRTLARLKELKASGNSYAQVADAANREGLSTRYGARWHTTSVHRILRRAGVPGVVVRAKPVSVRNA